MDDQEHKVETALTEFGAEQMFGDLLQGYGPYPLRRFVESGELRAMKCPHVGAISGRTRSGEPCNVHCPHAAAGARLFDPSDVAELKQRLLRQFNGAGAEWIR